MSTLGVSTPLEKIDPSSPFVPSQTFLELSARLRKARETGHRNDAAIKVLLDVLGLPETVPAFPEPPLEFDEYFRWKNSGGLSR
jgi:hypothetical protein